MESYDLLAPSGALGFRFSSPEAVSGLAKRLTQAMLAIEGRMEMRGEHPHFHYSFVTSEDVKAVARLALANAGIALIPAVMDFRRAVGGNNLHDTRIEYILACEEGFAVVSWRAESLDSQDKGIPKALTVGTKYFLINLLLIPTGDDPDPDSEHLEVETGGDGTGSKPKTTGSKPKTTGSKPKTTGSKAPASKPKGDFFTTAYDALIKNGWANHPKHAAEMYALYIQAGGGKQDLDAFTRWAEMYRGLRKDGQDKDQAADLALIGLTNGDLPENEAEFQTMIGG